MRDEKDYADYNYNCTGEIKYEGTTIHCAKNKVHGMQDLMIALANSCNTSYSNIGLGLNMTQYRKTAKDLLFNSTLPSVLPYRKSGFQLDEKSSASEIMMTAIGQGKTQVSPYHMALITAGIANGGILMDPYLVDSVVSYTGEEIIKNMPKKYAQLMTSGEAAQLKEYMKAVVDSGTAGALKNSDYTVAGKTGTAEYSSDKEKAHSWFVGFTNVDNPELVISVVIEGADSSGVKAVSVAKKVFNAYY
jgi:peptidoglycan glycosyltransferase